MKRLFLCVGLIAAASLTASTAMAGGVNFAWTNCFGEGSPVTNKTFACTSNSGTNIAVGSFILDAPIVSVSGNEMVIDLISTTSPLPNWWQFKNVGTCRSTALGVNFVMNGANVVCVDWGLGQSNGAVGAYQTTGGVNGWSIDPSVEAQHARIKLASAVAPSALVDLDPSTEYWSFNLTISNAKTVGTGLCAGCTDPVCLVLNMIRVTTSTGLGDLDVVNAAAAGSNMITWQGAGANCAAVPVRNRTWGQVKALYR